MDFRYELYLRSDDKYYRKPDYSASPSFRAELPVGWITKKEEHWQHYAADGAYVPDQGWKIHLSALVSDAQAMLDAVADIFFSDGISFKHVITENELALKNSKYGERGAAGKFITVYPRDADHFVTLLNILHERTADFTKGPYILSDERWKDGNVYYRYGGFIDMPLDVDGETVSAIRTPSGELIPDSRGAVYVVPDFVEVPEEITAMNQARPVDESEQQLDRYQIENALHFSDGGGVYKAVDQESGIDVVLKEGRPGAGLDGTMRDAYTRVAHESKILQRLSGSPFVPKWHSELQIWEHLFVVMDHVEGENLGSFIAKNYPFAPHEDCTPYTEQAITILKRLIEAIEDVHARGVGLGDLHPGNVIVETDGNNDIHLIDFELSSDLSDSVAGGLITRGFVGNPNHTREQADWFALKRIARQIFLVVGPVEDLAGSMWDRQKHWIGEQFGPQALSLLDHIDDLAMKHEATQVKTPLSPAPQPLCQDSTPQVVQKLRSGLEKNLDATLPQLGYGDIRQYEQDGGTLGVAYGAFGILLALHRTGSLPEVAQEWLSRFSPPSLQTQPRGLFSGSVGIANTLTVLGHREAAQEILADVTAQTVDPNDVTLHSGLAGVVLGLIDAHFALNDLEYLRQAKECGELLVRTVDRRRPIRPDDPDTIPSGLFNGWTGAGLALATLAKVTSDTAWESPASEALTIEIDALRDGRTGDIQLESGDGRLLPYLQCGSGGVGIALAALQPPLSEQYATAERFEGIRQAAVAKPCYGAGLFRGATGLLSVANHLHVTQGYAADQTTIPALDAMNQYLLAEDDDLYLPGDFNYRLSSDLATGSAGLLTTLADLGTRSLGWMPFVHLFQEVPAEEPTQLIGSGNHQRA